MKVVRLDVNEKLKKENGLEMYSIARKNQGNIYCIYDHENKIIYKERERE